MEDYEYYHAQEYEDTVPPERIKSAFSIEYFADKIHAMNHSRDWLEHQLAKALYVIHQRNFRETIE